MKKQSDTFPPKTLNNDEFEEVLIFFIQLIHNRNHEETIFWDLAKNCISKLGFVDCVVYTVDSRKKQLIQKAAYGPKNPKEHEIYRPITIPLGQGISGSVALSGKAEIVPDTSVDPRYIVDDEKRLSEIAVPIISNSTVWGVIDCEHPSRNFFNPQHLRILTTIAAVCAVKIGQIRMKKQEKEKQKKLLQVRHKLQEIQLEAFRSQMNPHFVFNTLNAIQSFITSDQKIEALQYLSIFSKLMRYHVNSFNKTEVPLITEINMIHSYLRLQMLRYENRFSYNLTQIPDIHIKADIPAFVLQTVLENIIESAIIDHFQKTHIAIHFEISAHTVIASILISGNALKTTYRPEYREKFSSWEEQIKKMNHTHPYIIEVKKKNHLKNSLLIEEIRIIFPNLAL